MPVTIFLLCVIFAIFGVFLIISQFTHIPFATAQTSQTEFSMLGQQNLSEIPLFTFVTELQGDSKQIAAVLPYSERVLGLLSLSNYDNHTYYKFQNTAGNWSNWLSLGGNNKQISTVSDPDGKITIFSIDVNNVPSYKSQLTLNGTWSNWKGLGGSSKQVTAIYDGNNATIVFSITPQGPLFYKKLEKFGDWTEWKSLDGYSKQITTVRDKGTIGVFSIGKDDGVYYKPQTGNDTFSKKWISLGGAAKQITAVENNDIFTVFSIGLNSNHVYYMQITPNGTKSSSWMDLGGNAKNISVSTQTKGAPLVFMISNDGTIYYKSSQRLNSNWNLLLGLGKAKQIIANPYANGANSIFMVSLGYNQIFYGELSAGSVPLITDGNITASLITNRLSFPTTMTFVDNDTILVLQKNDGLVRIIRNGSLEVQPVLDLSVSNIGERGALGITVEKNNDQSLHNRSGSNKTVFIYITESSVDGGQALGNRVYKYIWNGTKLVNPTLLLDLPAKFVDHNGGKLVYGSDRMLYVVIGDQNLRSKLQNVANGTDSSNTGVILRIKPDGTAPPDNPFLDMNKNSSLNAFFAYGIRNSFGIAMDPITGNIWETENGDTANDEINLFLSGSNGGWYRITGQISRANITEKDLVKIPGSHYSDPVFTWQKQVGVTDIEFFNSEKLGPKYLNNIFVGDFNSGNLYFFQLNKFRTGIEFDKNKMDFRDVTADNMEELSDFIFAKRFGGITDIQTGPDGSLYILTYTGSLYNLHSHF